ncbi:MAG: GIY-YIG nuclease family protein [Bacteroidales bacterium]|nr:GIY-YIG nuclease family protein [Bacteroidales bacterium]
MDLSYKVITGQPALVAASISRSIGQFERYYHQIKIGITANPSRRSKEHACDGWKRMLVKYKSSSVRNANVIEKYFIAHRKELTNEWNGYSKLPEPGPYYVYLLMK